MRSDDHARTGGCHGHRITAAATEAAGEGGEAMSTWTQMRSGHQHLKGDHTTWVCRSGATGWLASVRGLRPEPNAVYATSADARAAVEHYMDAGLHLRPYGERLAIAQEMAA
jgi:hypothetical protein